MNKKLYVSKQPGEAEFGTVSEAVASAQDGG